jgi:ribonuclease P protein component
MAEGRSIRPTGERLARAERLRRRAEYERCYREGRRRGGALLVVHAFPNEMGRPRLGLTVGRAVGGAAARNRLKRRVREIYRRWSERSRLPGLDLVVHAKRPAAAAPFAELRSELERLLCSLLPPPTHRS